MMFTYQKTNRYFAQIAPGLEGFAEQELHNLGGREVKPAYRGIYFSADRASLYRINYCSRFCSRILAPLLRFDCHSSKYLYKTARKIEWQALLTPTTTFAVSANSSHSHIRHSQYAALTIKDAIADSFLEALGIRPSVDRLTPDVRLHLHLENNKATIYLDTSGGALHRRGYRRESVVAPMQETIAAAVVAYSGWDGNRPLHDPFCGSGTLLLEALMYYCRIPAGYLRKAFGFQKLPDFEKTLGHRIKEEVDRQIRPLPCNLIHGSDIDPGAVRAARENARQLPGGTNISFEVKAYGRLPALDNFVILCNPPYGMRLKKHGNTDRLLAEFSQFCKEKCKGSTVSMFLGKKELAKCIGLRPAARQEIRTGGLDGILLRYEIFRETGK
ncbi:MAG: THUMP domain-containing protein [Deltaproteobacteria bacterium]